MQSDVHPLKQELFADESPKFALADEAYHGLAGDFVRLTLPQTEADPVALLVSFLIIAGVFLCGRGYAVACGATHRPNVFGIFAGDTGQGRKGTAVGHALRVASLVDPEFDGLRVIRGLTSGEGLIKKMQDKASRLVLDDRRFLCVLSEFGGLLEVMTRQGNTLSYCLRQAWDGEPLAVSTRKDPLEVEDYQLSLIGQVTPKELLNGLSKVSYVNGFANRFLFFRVHRSKYLPEGGNAINYSDIAARLREMASGVGEPLIMERTEAARLLWEEHYKRLSTPEDTLKGALSSRAEAHCLRLSVLYALLDKSSVVDVPHLRAALALWEYSGASITEIFGASLGVDVKAQKICDALARGPLNSTELSGVFRNNEPAEWLHAKLAEMVKSGLIVPTKKECNRKKVDAWMLR
jgi:hypothetical protein